VAFLYVSVLEVKKHPGDPQQLHGKNSEIKTQRTGP
jgi:hypothetical protein